LRLIIQLVERNQNYRPPAYIPTKMTATTEN